MSVVSDAAMVTLTCRCGESSVFPLSQVLLGLNSADKEATSGWLVVSFGLGKDIGVLCPDHTVEGQQ